MVKKTPQSSLKNRQNDLYVNSRANLGSNSEILIQAGDIATNRGYSHQTRIAKIGALLKEGQDTFTAGEKQYAQLLLNNSQSYLQNQAEKGRIKNYSIVKDNISTLKNSIRTSPEYKQVIPITYTPSPVETIEIRKPASQLENVVKAEFTPITTPANVTPVSFLGRTGKSLARFAAIGTLAAVTTFYGLLGVSCHDRKEAKIAQLQTEKVNLEEERTKLSGSLVSANINYDRATNDLANLQGQYTDATNTSHNLSTNLTALTKEHSLATNDLAGVRRDHGNATNALDKAEVKLTELQADL
ncbi:MAG: hypothetical protein Q7R87_02345, partial [Nanoarchaeota archaeon]|nr:hypothetical protein [Nanoarchaeota archaeon]